MEKTPKRPAGLQETENKNEMIINICLLTAVWFHQLLFKSYNWDCVSVMKNFFFILLILLALSIHNMQLYLYIQPKRDLQYKRDEYINLKNLILMNMCLVL